MRYKIRYSRAAEKNIKNLPKDYAEKILKEIESLSENPRPFRVEPLYGKLKGYLRVRIGSYRVMYSVDDGILMVYIINVENRQSTYKKK